MTHKKSIINITEKKHINLRCDKTTPAELAGQSWTRAMLASA
ncbi:hypothetical protein SAMN04490195_3099 [Pseudomonas moorei]|jgi:hypothetical protein|uniref:Uncharacterized protein n=1 Tax=Pseudomonas moorei TaxID=395599 RepID=A0A1H1G5D3_9PSED|nr:hypothetical protein SAMN04490195_3099 [Pseudomonas moorei]